MIDTTLMDAIETRKLQKSMADLHRVSLTKGLIVYSIKLGIVIALTTLAFNVNSNLAFLGLALLTGVAYSSLMILSHDAIHSTLTGMSWLDWTLPRLTSAPLWWFHGLYGELHMLHHKMNATDLHDPERVQWTDVEYANANVFGKWYARNQIIIKLFVFGGFGLVIDLVIRAIPLYSKSKGIRREIWTDALLIIGANLLILALGLYFGFALKYIVFYICLERSVGVIMQFRGHVEHYGLWGKSGNYIQTQIMNCRNIQTNSLMSWYVNHLNFHSVHHAFPKIPFYNLEAAHQRMCGILSKNGCTVVTEHSYIKTIWRLIAQPKFIKTHAYESKIQAT